MRGVCDFSCVRFRVSKCCFSAHLTRFFCLAAVQFSTWTHAYVESYATDHAYAFFRGSLLVLLGNRGAGAPQFETLSITRHPYSAGAKLCSLLFAGDCPTVGANGTFAATLFHGEPNLYAPATAGN